MVITQVFLSSAEHKEDILKNVGKQTVDSSHSKVFFSPYCGSQWLTSVNYDNILILGELSL